MHNLTAVCALGGTEPKREQINGTRIAELPDIALISVALRQRARLDLEQFRNICGVGLPDPGRASTKAGRAVMWLGPEQFLYESPYNRGEDALKDLQQTLGNTVSLTDQSDAWAVLSLSGANCVAALERLVMLDVASMDAGAFGRTSLDHSGVLIRCLSPGETFRLYAIRSYARSVYHALHTALTSCRERQIPYSASVVDGSHQQQNDIR